MITIPTTLVLGAGASMPYGFPSGYELRKLLCNPNNLRPLSASGLFGEDDVNDFCTAFLRSSVESIDAFLAKRGTQKLPYSNRTFEEVGKAAIAAVLIAREDVSKLFDDSIDDHWYSYLWQYLGTSVEDFENSNLSIVTFNYDRSLECYLTETLKNSFGIDELDAAMAVSKMRILHVYGKLGDLPNHGSAGTRPYLPQQTSSAILNAAAGLKIIAESRDDDAVLESARQYLTAAERICFLGFGFDRTNVERLRIKEILRQKYMMSEFRGPDAYSTSLHLATAEQRRLQQLLMPELRDPQTWQGYVQKNYGELRKKAEDNLSRHTNEKSRSYLRHVGLFD